MAAPPPAKPDDLPSRRLTTGPVSIPPNAPDATSGAPDPAASTDDARDLLLVARIRAGEPGAWQTLVQRHQDRLFAICYRMVGTGPRAREIAADLTQDALVKIIQGLPSFSGEAKLTTWMIRVTMNVCLSWQRGQKHRRHASLDAPASGSSAAVQGGDGAAATFASLLAGREQTGASRVQHDEFRGHIAQALASIDPEQRALLILRDVRDLDYEHIAQVLEIPIGTVKSRVFRARAALREAYEALAKPAADADS